MFASDESTTTAAPLRTQYDYDVIIVGGSIAGPSLSKALADQGRRVLMVERSLWEKPDRIVGELLQPGGIMALQKLGMEKCATSMGCPCSGYLVIVFFLSTTTAAPLRTQYDYDVIIVGGSIAGPALSKALADQGRRVLMVERSLWEKPDRIVGELLQPGGIMALQKLGMEKCATSMGCPCSGYLVIDDEGKRVNLPYEEGFSGVSFHFGDFVMNLRKYVWNHCRETVSMVEGTVTDLLTERDAQGKERVYGITYTRDTDAAVQSAADPFAAFLEKSAVAGATTTTKKKVTLQATAPLVVMCDGGSSKFKSRINHYRPARKNHSHFVGLILEGITLPSETRGHVFFGKTGPILSYRLDSNEVRFLVDYNKHDLPPPAELSAWLIAEVAPRLPENIRGEFIRQSKNEKNIRSMPIAQYPQVFPCVKGVVGVGDHTNQRHPLTGGGMTCCFRDAIRLSTALASIPSLRSDDAQETLEIQEQVHSAVTEYIRTRFLHASCINILSWALYAVFGARGMRNACFDYFLLGGDCVRGPMALLSGLDPSPATLLRHYTWVMLNGAWNMIAQTGSYSGSHPGSLRIVFNVLTFFVNPIRLYSAIALLVEATFVFAPLAWMEFVSIWRHWDATSDSALSFKQWETSLLRMVQGKTGRPVGL
ncbi:squalene monooxygenase-like protein, putative [Bodo saltans]|uniref:squalene monooxygenase n=1 Tax=Bodo saltans TaxID=75058 RepID=A0A0S4IT90_BODSA|nr:squalene monooxygenase-like protein, putative [Bodo saltans]|eukprot:CUF02143.1 squalene monooxygenase-like protein, putative [Bodo saltans]